jgi:hypothetical protein
MLRKVVGESTAADQVVQQALLASPHATSAAAAGSSRSRGRTASNVSVESVANTPGGGQGQGQGRGGAWTLGGVGQSGKSASWGFEGGAGAGGTGEGGLGSYYSIPDASSIPPPVLTRSELPVHVEASDLKLLLRRRPELVEFLLLEIQAMKLETDRLTVPM